MRNQTGCGLAISGCVALVILAGGLGCDGSDPCTLAQDHVSSCSPGTTIRQCSVEIADQILSTSCEDITSAVDGRHPFSWSCPVSLSWLCGSVGSGYCYYWGDGEYYSNGTTIHAMRCIDGEWVSESSDACWDYDATYQPEGTVLRGYRCENGSWHFQEAGCWDSGTYYPEGTTKNGRRCENGYWESQEAGCWDSGTYYPEGTTKNGYRCENGYWEYIY